GDLGILPDVREEVVANRGFGDLAEVEGLSRAPQDLDGRFGERHVELRWSAVGTNGGYPSAAPRNCRMSVLSCRESVNELVDASRAGVAMRLLLGRPGKCVLACADDPDPSRPLLAPEPDVRRRAALAERGQGEGLHRRR